jgi:serine kinase of HPr protein (carbohydrate metabolism regulator)
VLLRGPSGVGKSDLALRVLARGGRLIADDRVLIWASGGRLFGRAPAILAGLVEARGLGVGRARSIAMAEIVLAIDLTPSTERPERIPDPATAVLAGVELPLVALSPREESAPAKLEFALQAATLGAGGEQAYQAPRGRGR